MEGYDGNFVEMYIFVTFNVGNLEVDECAGCQAPLDEDTDDAVVYRISFTCEYLCAPPTDSPTPGPTPGPTPVPTPHPTPAPSGSIQPTDCYEKFELTPTDVISQVGANIPLPAEAVIVTASTENVVEFMITNVWPDENSKVRFQYRSSLTEEPCYDDGLDRKSVV